VFVGELVLCSSVDKNNTLHSFMLVHHGRVVADGWWKPEAPHKPHVLHSLITNYRLPITDYQSPITNHRLPITDYQSPITNHRLPITDYQLPITNLIVFTFHQR